ncbi:MAG: citramalate synthase [Actinobacteria bacterium]|uniref:(R)-citramalate synthase n=1 Tax=freshwater metagenome TaxID=449393 RepID=A0A6J7DJX1_9ZZZZ|nr:citramalate synthase [Actinomycetota bacterium]
MTRPDAFHVFDTTLRDGAQREGISFSVHDKLAVARLLDDYGVGFIEGGWPGAMPKDTEFFQRAQDELTLRNAQLVAFGATRKAGVNVQDDPQVRALLDSQAPVITIVAKSDVRHVFEALKTTLDENAAMVSDTVRFLVGEGRRVFVDMEHFFDGYKHDPDYGVRLLVASFEAGASVGVLCDTNGGMLPSGIGAIVSDVRERSGVRLGIHCQNDTSCAIANTISAVEAGVTHVQCTANGYGERTGNADLFPVVANLELKLGIECLPPGNLRETVRVSHAIAEIANIAPDTHQAYAGVSSFAHKAGLHASALKVNAELYNHIDPAVVGGDQRVLITEMAGRASVELKGRELGYDLSDDPALLTRVVEQVKSLESQGWTFEAADASFELLLASEAGVVRAFEVESWRTIVEQLPDGQVKSEATVKVHAGGDRIISTAEGNGPVNALDKALRAAMIQIYPELATLRLIDYKVRILEGASGTGAVTRVLVGTSDGRAEWSTVGVHENVIAASWRALEDAVTFGLLRNARSGEATE